MSSNESSLLLRIRGDSAGAKAAVAETRAAIASLRTSSTADLGAIKNAATGSLGQVTSTLTQVGGQLPIVGGAVSSLSSQFSSLTATAGATATTLPIVAGAAVIAAGAIGGIAKTLFDVTVSTAEFQGKLFDLSQQTGVSVETLSALEVIARTTGGSIEQIAGSLVIFQTNLDEAQDVASKAGQQFAQLGISTKNTEEAFRDALTVLAAMPEGFAQTNDAAELFGRRGGKAILAILKEMKGDLDGTIEKLRSLGILIDNETARAADEFNDQLALLQFQLRAAAGIIGNEVMPEISEAIRTVSRLFTDNRAVIVGWTRDIGDAARGATVLARVIADLGGQVTALSNIPTPVILEILKSLDVSGLSTLFSGLKSLGTPPIGPINVPSVAPVPLPSQAPTDSATAQQVSALKAASDAARRIATERIAEQERLFKLGKITREQETENIIAQLRIRAAAQQGALADEINLKLKQLEAEKDNATKRQQIIEQITNLQEQIKTNESELNRAIADKRAELQIQERRDLAQHEKAKLEILLSAGQAKIQLIESEIRAGIKTTKDGVAEIEAIEDQGFRARIEILQKELASLVDPAERRKVTDAIAKVEQERTANKQAQSTRRTEIDQNEVQKTLALNSQLAGIREAQREGELSRLNVLAEKGFVTESQLLAREIEMLTERHNDRLTLIEIEINAESTSAERQAALINEKIEAETRYTDEKQRLTQLRIEAILRERAALDPQLGGVGINPNPVDTSQLGLPPDATDDMIVQAAAARGAFEGLGAAISTSLGLGQQAGEIFGGVLTNVFGSLAHAVGDAVHAFVLFGTAGEGIKKFTATLIAEIARMAAVQAVWELAQGFAMLALNFFFPNPKAAASATAHFQAAAIFGGIAAIAATAGRAVAGNSFNQTSGGASGGGGGTQSAPAQQGPTVIERDRNRVSSQPQIQIVLNGDLSQFDTRVERAVVRGVNNNSRPLQTAITRARGNS